MTLMKMYGDFQKGQYQEKNLRYGVREHGMGAIANGIALHNPGMIPYCATFFNFTDYMRGAIRMSALSRVSICLCSSVLYPVSNCCLLKTVMSCQQCVASRICIGLSPELQ